MFEEKYFFSLCFMAILQILNIWNTAKLGYEVSEQSRLVFWLVGPNPGLVIFSLESVPEFFPHASDVWSVGTMDGDALYARIVKVKAEGQTITYGR